VATFHRILIPTDFSEPSEQALRIALEMARGAGADVVLLHICEIPTYAYVGIATPVDLLSPLAELAGQKLDELLKSLRTGFPGARSVLKVGVPWEQILATISEVGADLVVMGTHGRRGVAHALLGSVAEKIVRLSPVPVLTVRGSSTPSSVAG
jgi:nucleotide-binding universal stress UspA family protein